jgi:hypothetical protein
VATVLAAIDDALADAGVSDDAMRWSPNPPPVRRRDPSAFEGTLTVRLHFG